MTNAMGAYGVSSIVPRRPAIRARVPDPDDDTHVCLPTAPALVRVLDGSGKIRANVDGSDILAGYPPHTAQVSPSLELDPVSARGGRDCVTTMRVRTSVSSIYFAFQ
jgi:hypothetical protein